MLTLSNAERFALRTIARFLTNIVVDRDFNSMYEALKRIVSESALDHYQARRIIYVMHTILDYFLAKGEKMSFGKYIEALKKVLKEGYNMKLSKTALKVLA